MWTHQTVETLKRLALEGRSAAWIAAALGAPSRNAVIGKANRIGIKLAGVRSAAPCREDLALAAGAPWTRKRPPSIDGEPGPDPRPPVSHARSRVPATSRANRREGRSDFARAEVGEMRRLGISEIGETECRWPIGDPGEEDFFYCGLQVARGHAYCPGHCRLVYRTNS